MKTINFITGNKGKIQEATEKFRPLGINIKQKNMGYPEIQTDKLEKVAAFGVDHIQKQGIDHPFILEDAGIFIDKLQGFPGVYSAYVYDSIGLQGIIDLLANSADCRAVFRSVFAYAKPKGDAHFFIGECSGTVIKQEKGSNGFGYDPIFIPKGSDKTFAQMNTSEKNSFSHRGRSLEKLYDFLK